MQDNQKKSIAAAFKKKMDLTGRSQNMAAEDSGISPAHISNMLGGKWESVSEKMWLRMAAWAEHNPGWIIWEDLNNYKRIHRICEHARTRSVTQCIVAEPGWGKSASLTAYAATHPGVIYIQCSTLFTKKSFLTRLMRSLGVSEGVLGNSERMEAVIEKINETVSPLVIIDEVDKLQDSVLNLFHPLYNETQYRCGFVLSGSTYFEDHVIKGVRKNKLGFKELHSRFGGDFKKLHNIKASDITEICMLNGIEDEESIAKVVNTSRGDMRIMYRHIQDIIRQNRVAVKSVA